MMRWLATTAYYLKSLFTKRKLDEQLSEEVRVHVEMATEANLAKGMPPEDARHAALREFGNVAGIEERTRDEHGWVWLEQAGKDMGVALRRLRRSPSFFLAVVAVLGICLGGNLTIFAWVDAILLRPLPFPESEKLTLIYNTYPQAGVMRDGSSVTNYYERRGHLPAFSGLALYRPRAAIVGDPNSAQREATIRVTSEFFEVLGRGPVLGRAFKEADATPGAPLVVIISDAYWRKHFEADPHVIGRPLLVNGQPFTIVGVLPPDFRFLSFTAHLYFSWASRPEDRGPANRHQGGNVTVPGRIEVVGREGKGPGKGS